MTSLPSTLFAVHLSDGVLAGDWVLFGYGMAAALVAIALYRLNPEDLPRVGLLAATFFVASLIHVKVGPTSVHLLLNGLVGVMLAWRAPLAIAEALFLQVLLIGHGGWTTLGINTVILSIPALCIGFLFPLGVRWLRHSSATFHGLLAGVAVGGWLLSVFAGVEMLLRQWQPGFDLYTFDWRDSFTLSPIGLTGVSLVSLVVMLWYRRRPGPPNFPLGLLLGELGVLLTVILNFLVLLLGGIEDWQTLAVVVLLVHLPVAMLEGLMIAFLISFLLRVQPELVLRQSTL